MYFVSPAPVNVVLVSDHGMTVTAPGAVQRYHLDDYLDSSLVDSIADKGAFINIKAKEGNAEEVQGGRMSQEVISSITTS